MTPPLRAGDLAFLRSLEHGGTAMTLFAFFPPTAAEMRIFRRLRRLAMRQMIVVIQQYDGGVYVLLDQAGVAALA